MWSLEAPSERPPTDDAIIPSKVLYRYDGPTIFTAQLGLTNTLFLKVDELDGGDLFLAAPTTRDLISALEAGNRHKRANQGGTSAARQSRSRADGLKQFGNLFALFFGMGIYVFISRIL